VVALVCAVAGLVFVWAAGVFSPAVAVIVFALAFFPNGSDTKMIFLVGLGFIVAYALLGVLVIEGVIADEGTWMTTDTFTRWRITSLSTVIMLAQFTMSRLNRRATERAIARLHEAAQVARTREAQLNEEREERAVALRHGEGHLTGVDLGDWRLGKIVGRGAMGEVYAATSKRDSTKAAVKVLLAEHDGKYLERFAREAQIARVTHGTNLVTLYESGTTESGLPYIVMELLEGEDLGAILRKQSLPLSEVLALVEQAAQGLSILHESGVVHRDLKPQNLFRARGSPPVWKILDYGVAKIVGAETVTQEAIIGTPAYMSPEQAEGGAIDARSDVFSLGTVAYRALVGRRPFSGNDIRELLDAVIRGRPTRPSELLPSLPSGVERVLAIALARRPEDRFSTALEFAEALRAAVNGVTALPAFALKHARSWGVEPTTLTIPHWPD
jgi:serine/threonine-protein kinase